MSNEILLRGVLADNKRCEHFGVKDIDNEIRSVGKHLASKLNPFVKVVEDKEFYPGFVFWESENLKLDADEFHIERISFGRDIAFDSTFSLSMLGMANYNNDLWNGFGSDLQVCFRLRDDKLRYSETVFLGQGDHRLHFESIMQFDIDKKTQLQIMNVANRVVEVFTRLELVY